MFEWCYSGQKFQRIAVSIFYLEEHHSDLPWNEYKKLYVAITDSPILNVRESSLLNIHIYFLWLFVSLKVCFAFGPLEDK